MDRIAISLLPMLVACGASATECPDPATPEAAHAGQSGAEARPVAAPGPLDADVIARESGVAQPQVQPDGVVRISWARDEVPVVVDGTALPPPAGLGSWAAFAGLPGGAMAMGDTVVFEDEIDAAMDAAFAANLEVTAIHNHFVFEQPRVFFMHVGGHGDPAALARGIRGVWDAIRAVRRATPMPRESSGTAPAQPGALDAAALEAIVGRPAQVQGSVVRFTIAREGTMHGLRVGGSMGLTTWAAFSGSDARAAIDGDFIMTGDEVQRVLRALRRGGLHVVALHNHMVGEAPSFYFTHYWGVGPAAELARAFRAVLDAQAGTPAP